MGVLLRWLMPAINIKEPFVGLERNGEIHIWLCRRLWDLSKSLPVFEFEIASFNSFDKDVWFGDQRKPTVNNILDHYRRIEKADFKYPIILSHDGSLLDGIHRICCARLDGRKTIPTVQFKVDPEPDQRHPAASY